MRYLLFAGEKYYPRGGIKDLIQTSNSVNELVLLAIEQVQPPQNDHHNFGWAPPVQDKYEWWNIYDTQTGEAVELPTNCKGNNDYKT